MGIFSFLSGGISKDIAEVAKEWITTDKESAEAKAIMVKTLDPNGAMRRDISMKVSNAYMTYLFVTACLVLAHAFNMGNVEQVKTAIESLTDLFVPITTMFGTITGASFGVNGINSIKEKK